MSQSNLPNDRNNLREELEDRLADLALSEILGGQRPPDLSQRVATTVLQRPTYAWRKFAWMAGAASLLMCAGAIYLLSQRIHTQSVTLIDGSFSSSNRVASQPDHPSFTDSQTRTKDINYIVSKPLYETKTKGQPQPDVSEFESTTPVSSPDPAAPLNWAARPALPPSTTSNLGDRSANGVLGGEGRPGSRNDRFDFGVDGGQTVSDQTPRLLSTVPNPRLPEPAVVGPRIIVREETEKLPLGEKPDEGRGPGQGGDRYSRIVENPFLKATENPLSTFSIDVDTASYAKARRYLMQNGVLPPPDAVRIEEFVNYFHYDYEPPKDEGKPFAAHVEVAACPWEMKHRLVRIGLKGREIDREARPTSNLVFLLDVSGSMTPEDKLPRVRRSMRMLVEQLGENDRVAIVVYAGATGLALPSTPGYRKDEIFTALDNLHAGGSTNGGAGIRLAYDVATTNFIKGGTNRVILCTDGDFNVGTTSTAELERLAEEKAKTNVFLTVLGFGMGNHNDDMLEKLADKGNGNYGYIDTEEEARKLLVEELSGTLVTIAKDVKIQIEFNPRTVGAYRLLGYENRMLRAEDFNDDKKDAGEIGAGHTVTALYEIVPAGEKIDTPPVDPLRYQQVTRPSDAAVSGELLTLKLRYKEPDGQESKAPLIFPVSDRGQQFGQASKDFKFAAAVASFAMLLRDSQHRGNTSYDAVLEIAQEGRGEDRNGYRASFLEIVKRAKQIAGK